MSNQQRRRLLQDLGYGKPTAASPATRSDAYYWGEVNSLGLANNATFTVLPDQSATGTSFVNSGNAVYKTNVLNGYAVAENGAFFFSNPAAQLAQQTLVLVSKCLTVVNTNDVLNNAAAATRLRMASPGYDFFSNAAGGTVAVGGTTLQSFDTVIIRVATNPGPMIIRINGVQMASFNPHANWYTNQILKVHASMSGQLAVFGRFNTDIGDSGAASIETYLRNKFQHY